MGVPEDAAARHDPQAPAGISGRTPVRFPARRISGIRTGYKSRFAWTHGR